MSTDRVDPKKSQISVSITHRLKEISSVFQTTEEISLLLRNIPPNYLFCGIPPPAFPDDLCQGISFDFR